MSVEGPRRSGAGGARRRRGGADGFEGGGATRTPGERRQLARDRLIESRLTPNAISLTGFALNIVAAVLVTQRYFFLAGVAFIVGSVMDTLDGRYSRMSGKGTAVRRFPRLHARPGRGGRGARRGGRLLRRAGATSSPWRPSWWPSLASLMVSYTRARAEALGVECKVGLATRPVRVVIISAGLVFAKGASLGNFSLLEPAIYVLAALTTVTVLQRVLHVRRQLVRLAEA